MPDEAPSQDPIQKRMDELRELHRCYVKAFNNSTEGGTVLRDLLPRTFVNRPMFDENDQARSELLLLREGRRSIGLHIQYMLDFQNFTDQALLKRLEKNNGR